MYREYFGLKEKPFTISPDPRFVYLSSQHDEALARCEYAITERMGLSVVYGDIGLGKTSLIRRLAGQFGEDPTINLAVLVEAKYPTDFQLMREIRREFGLTKHRKSLTDERNDFQDFLYKQHELGKTTVLFIDEAQMLTPSFFEMLRVLLNFETNTEKLLQIALFGQNELVTKIERLPALKDRVAVFAPLTSLNNVDTTDMIRFRWHVAGGDALPFSADALDAVFRHSRGRPRLICKLCHEALSHAFADGRRLIDGAAVDLAARTVNPTLVKHTEQPVPTH